MEIHGDDIWQLLFTSGTTAMPKGVMLSHHASHYAALNFGLSLTRGVRLECDVRVGTFPPMIYHVGDQIFPLPAFLAGGSLVLGRKPVVADIVAAVADARVSALWGGSPQMVAALSEHVEASGADISCLKVLVYGWGAVPPATYAALQRQAGDDFVLMGIFGQTETIACHRFWPARWPDVYERTAPALNYIGVPSPLLASDVVDGDGNSVRDKPGTPGEAVYRSPTVTSGYYLNEEATREAFRGGWFHSGDGAVIGLPHEHWGEAVTAIVVRKPGAEPSEDELIAHCRERLAGFETPKAIVFADAVPDTVAARPSSTNCARRTRTCSPVKLRTSRHR